MADENTKPEDTKEEETTAPEAAEEKKEEKKEEAPKEEKKEEAKEEETKEVDTSALSKDAVKVLEMVEKMSMLELAELVKVMEEKFGVSAAAPMAMMAGGAAGGGEEAAEKTSFDVELTDAGGQKIAVIKVVKDILGVGLKEAKDLVDGAPKAIKEGVSKDEAEDVKAKLEEAGAKVEIK